jgi:hypothetical protein
LRCVRSRAIQLGDWAGRDGDGSQNACNSGLPCRTGVTNSPTDSL